MSIGEIANLGRVVLREVADVVSDAAPVAASGQTARRVATGLDSPVTAPSGDDLLASMLRESAALRGDATESFAKRAARELDQVAASANAVPASYTRNPRKAAQAFGVTKPDINDAIHAVKADGKIGGAQRNGDVWIDTADGEVYAVLASGGASAESMGNLLRFLTRS